MKAKELFDLTIVSRRIKSSMLNEAYKLEQRGIGRSTIAYSDCVSMGFAKLNEELQMICNRMAKLVLTPKEIRKLSGVLINFIDSNYDEIIETGRQCSGNIDVSRYNYDELFREKLSESKSFINYEIELMLSLLKEKNMGKWWDVGKILLASIAGSALTYAIKYFFDNPTQ